MCSTYVRFVVTVVGIPRWQAGGQPTATRLRLNRNLVDLIGGMAGAFVDALHGLGAGCLRQAEDHP
jgi:hypothetical protein